MRKMRLSDVVTGLRSRNGPSLKSSAYVLFLLYQRPDVLESASRKKKNYTGLGAKEADSFLSFSTMVKKYLYIVLLFKFLLRW